MELFPGGWRVSPLAEIETLSQPGPLPKEQAARDPERPHVSKKVLGDHALTTHKWATLLNENSTSAETLLGAGRGRAARLLGEMAHASRPGFRDNVSTACSNGEV